ncbi:MAG: LemA family protein [Deltaproteobacteria bacterium]|nr:LemA family protein [Deltaproteobacteria bacterium]
MAADQTNPEAIGLLFLVIVVTLVVHLFMYDRINSLRNQVQRAFDRMADILKGRWKYIPGLVESLRDEMREENTLLAEILYTQKRAVSTDITSRNRIVLDNQLSQAVSRLMTELSGNPEIRDSEYLQHLDSMLAQSDMDISEARADFNLLVREYNQTISQYPAKLLARFFGFTPWEILTTTPAVEGPAAAKPAPERQVAVAANPKPVAGLQAVSPRRASSR